MPSSEETEDVLLPFGVSARTGLPLPSLSEDAIREMLQRETVPAPEKPALDERASTADLAFAVEGGIDPAELGEAGWGVLFAPGLDPQIKDALKPLLDHRQAGGAAPFVVFDGPTTYRAGDTAESWLARQNGVRLDVVNPDNGVPYYLLIVGSPEVIPFEFQYVLDLYWAVGRLWFDTVAEFRRYAESVVKYETDAQVPTSRQIALFAPEHDFDAATQLFTKQVARPMAFGEGDKPMPVGKRQNFAVKAFLGDEATKASLTKLLRGEIDGGPPSILFSGGHGMAFDSGDAEQFAAQGALVCQDWGGHGSITKDHWFAASDVPADARVHGLIHFLFACHGGGCTQLDNFDRLNDAPREIAPRPFFSRLPQALLAHPKGGALAVLAHIERAWAYGFQGAKGNAQIQGFRDVLGRLLRGERIGQATDVFNVRWAALSTRLAEMHVELQHNNPAVSLRKLGQLWVARDDARNFMILGDPAVRLREEDLPPLA
jgi:hypothetical protein